MIYAFECPECQSRQDVWLEIKDCMEPQTCSICNSTMVKLISLQKPIIHTYGQYNPGLGIVEKNKDSVNDELKRRQGTKDELVPIGDANLDEMKRTIKPKYNKIPSGKEILYKSGTSFD